jgi:hypothetical protein
MFALKNLYSSVERIFVSVYNSVSAMKFECDIAKWHLALYKLKLPSRLAIYMYIDLAFPCFADISVRELAFFFTRRYKDFCQECKHEATSSLRGQP